MATAAGRLPLLLLVMSQASSSSASMMSVWAALDCNGDGLFDKRDADAGCLKNSSIHRILPHANASALRSYARAGTIDMARFRYFLDRAAHFDRRHQPSGPRGRALLTRRRRAGAGPSHPADFSFLEMQRQDRNETLSRHHRRRRGFFGKLVGGALRAMGLGMVYPKFSSRYSKYSAPWAKDEGCVVCQYLLEMTEVDIWQNGIRRYPGMARRDWRERVRSFYSAAKWGRNTSRTAKFMVDTADANSGEFSMPPSVHGFAGVLPGLSREQTREKYAEIYHSMDRTLDRVCEQSMPIEFYKWCRQVYSVQVRARTHTRFPIF